MTKQTNKKLSLREKVFNVQQDIEAVTKSKENPYYKSKYADISDYLKLLLPELKKQRIAITQKLDNVDGKPVITTTLRDLDSADKITGSIPIMADGNIQNFCGSITYLRRYSLVSMFALKDKDDDGNSAVKRPKQKKVKEKKTVDDIPFGND